MLTKEETQTMFDQAWSHLVMHCQKESIGFPDVLIDNTAEEISDEQIDVTIAALTLSGRRIDAVITFELMEYGEGDDGFESFWDITNIEVDVAADCDPLAD